MVVGGGPAGLEAARVAAARGHRGVLLEASDELGGHVRLEAAIPYRRELFGIPDHYRRQLGRLGVDVRLETTATADRVRAERPDAVVVATGSRPMRPDVPMDGMTVVTADDVLAGRRWPGVSWCSTTTAGTGAPARRSFLPRTARVSRSSHQLHVGMRLDPSNLVPVFRHLYEAGIALTPSDERRGARGGAVRLRNVFIGIEVEREADALVVALLRRTPQDGLYHALRGDLEGHLVGDASAARPTDKVILEAAVLARRL